jgi:hypothetical protein
MFRSYDHLKAENILLSRITQLPQDGRTTETRKSIVVQIVKLTYHSDVV